MACAEHSNADVFLTTDGKLLRFSRECSDMLKVKVDNLKGLPKFPPNKQVEVIYLIVDKPEQKKCTRRFPHRDIAGKMRIMGNIFDTASEKDWNLPK